MCGFPSARGRGPQLGAVMGNNVLLCVQAAAIRQQGSQTSGNQSLTDPSGSVNHLITFRNRVVTKRTTYWRFQSKTVSDMHFDKCEYTYFSIVCHGRIHVLLLAAYIFSERSSIAWCWCLLSCYLKLLPFTLLKHYLSYCIVWLYNM